MKIESERRTILIPAFVMVFALLIAWASGCKAPAPLSEHLAEREVPGQEFRGVWLTTISNLDWPSSRNLTVDEQKTEALAMLDSLKKIGINAVILQIRPESDALYASSYDPWSWWLTGEQGRAPDPFYDPLEFFVREAHNRGMELHAWINPFRVERMKGTYDLAGSHIARRQPEWVINVETGPGEYYSMLDPGLPGVRDYLTGVVMDIARRYDVDGIHFDDYFYPYTPITGEDSLTFQRHRGDAADIESWRRNNITQFIAQVHDSLQAEAPHKVFGISPFGVRKNSDTGSNALEGYYDLYADPLAWLQEGTVDYITPQLYFVIGNERADYRSLLAYWARAAEDHRRHLYAGLAPYRLLPPIDWTLDDAIAQLILNSRDDRVQGNIYFRARHLIDNPKGYSDILRNTLYRYPSLTPSMSWKSMDPPQNPACSRHPGAGTGE
jgi:uncharacterized lipoprotein YddW (UPF0748 family)